MKRRGPDTLEQYCNKIGSNHVTLLHSRLSIIDLDDRANQPMQRGPHIVITNGEIYNFVELREKYSSFPYRTLGDMETVLAAMDFLGRDFVHALKGMFALGIYEVPERHLTLLRDHTGIKPLFWGQFGGSFIFGSELKPFFEFF